MLLSEPLDRSMLVNGTFSDKTLGNSTVQNGDCSLVVQAPKYKRRKVSAVRDFPPGCGRFAQQINSILTQETDTVAANGHEKPIIEGGVSGGINDGSLGLSKDLQEDVAATLREEVIPVLLDDKFFLPSNGSVAVTNGNGSEKHVRKYPPRRKVSAIRDFPPNCGRNAPRLGEVELVKGCASLEHKSLLDLEKSDFGMNDKTPTETVSIDDWQLADDAQDRNSSKRLETRSFEVTRKLVQLKELDSGMSDKSREETAEIDVKTTVEDAQDGDLDKSNLEKNNAKLLKDAVQSKKSVELLALSKEKAVGQEKLRSRVDDKPSTAMIMANLKPTIGDAQPKESLEVVASPKNKSKLEGHASIVNVSKFQLESEKIAREDESEMKVDQENEETLSKPLFEDKLYWWDHEFETVVAKGDNDVEGSEEDLGKDVVYSEVKEEKEKQLNTPGYHDQMQEVDIESLELASGRLVVQGLMAASSCPWRQGKNACKSNLPDGTTARKGTKLDMTSPVGGQKTKMTARKKVDGNDSRENSQKKIFPKAASQGVGQLVVWEKDNSFQHNEDLNVAFVSRSSDMTSPVGGKFKMSARKKVDRDGSRENSRKKIFPKAASQEGVGQLVVWEKDNSLQHNEDRNVALVSRSADFYIPPLGPGTSSLTDQDSDGNATRHKVKETLRLYQTLCRKLLQEDETKSKDAKGRKRIDLKAAAMLKERKKYVNEGKQILGTVPVVEVGDEYQYRAELNIIGLHRQIQGGIDYVKHNGKIIATSVVASGGYADDLDDSDVLIYTGQGGNVMQSDKEPEDQKLERGNLALKNSVDEKTPVRVIRGWESADGKSKTYIYDGLYLVHKYWQVVGPHGKLVYQFQLERIPGQPVLARKEVKKSKKSKVREGICVDDISLGKEVIPICAVNTVNDEKPPPFQYITSMIYPDWYNPTPPEGCNCTMRCSDSLNCSCAVKNGGEIPFNHNGAIVEVKPLVYECGPTCKCSSTCHNRVSQHGIRFQLEIFKTRQMGWGVRSLTFIPSGSFICEYIGELLREKDADQRMGNDEYLFDIGNNYSDSTHWDGLSNIISEAHPVSYEAVGDGGFTIDAAEFGNVGRFINHSCTPNLYAQNVLFNHGDKRFPRIMLFAAENIPPLQELTYHYNYTLDQVHDSDGNIKKKSCFCGSHECTGRLY